MGDFLRQICAKHGFTAVTVGFNTRTHYAFGAFVHTSAGHVGHGTGDAIEGAVEAAIADLRARFPAAA